jgi:hypothetical protein
MSGIITVKSKEECFTSFVVTLPVVQEFVKIDGQLLLGNAPPERCTLKDFGEHELVACSFASFDRAVREGTIPQHVAQAMDA